MVRDRFDRKPLPAATVRRAFIDLSATHTCAIRIQLQFSIVVVVVLVIVITFGVRSVQRIR